MKNLAIATTILFAAIAQHTPENLLAAALVTCVSYILWGFEMWVKSNVKVEKEVELSENDKLEMEFRKKELLYKISETERQQAIRTEMHLKKQNQDKLLEKGVGW